MNATLENSLFRINYQYVAASGQLRAASIVLPSESADKAREASYDHIPDNHKFPSITSVTRYATAPQTPNNKPKK